MIIAGALYIGVGLFLFMLWYADNIWNIFDTRFAFGKLGIVLMLTGALIIVVSTYWITNQNTQNEFGAVVAITAALYGAWVFRDIGG